MAAEMLAGPAMKLAFDLFLGSVKGTIQKAGIFKDTLKKIQEKLEALSPLIKQMKESNIVLGLPDSELESFTKKMKEGKELVDECSKTKKWNVLDKSRHTSKLNDFNKSLDELFTIVLQAQQARDGKVNQIWIQEIRDGVQRIEKATSVGVGGTSSSTTRAQVEGKLMKISAPAFTVGLDAPLECLKKKILEGDRSVHVLTAPGGFGKTTLAKKLCGDDQIIEKFNTNILFVNFSKTPNLIRIVQNLYKHQGQEVPTLGDEEDAIHHLGQLLPDLVKSPILLVLDDVWSGSEYLIEKFNLQIPDYKVLVTSRFEFPGFAPRYDLEILNDEDAITLFCNHAFPKNGSSNNIPDDLVNKVAVEHCKKVPLALELIGISLRNKPRPIWQREVRKWSERTSSVLSYEAKLLRCLQSSVDILEEKDPNLKECFMDLGSFPEDQRIPVSALIDLWTELYELEESDAIAYLLDLTYHSLANLEDTRDEVHEEYADHSKIFITQHDMLRELAIHQSSRVTEQQRKRLLVDLTGGNLPNWWKKKNEQPFTARLVSISTDELFSSEWCDMQLPETKALVLNFHEKNDALPEFVKSMSKLKVLIVGNDGFFLMEPRNFQILGSLTNLKRIRLQGIAIPTLCESFMKLENLQKLSMVRCEIFGDIKLSEIFPNLVEINFDDVSGLEKLPDTFCDSVSLKQISITDCNWLYSLPDEIENLINLEVLRLRCCTYLGKLPDSVCKLSKLTFLDISYCPCIRNLPEHIGELRSLRKFNMGCTNLQELPPSVSDLEQLKDVVCSKRLKGQWELYLPNTKLTLTENPVTESRTAVEMVAAVIFRQALSLTMRAIRTECLSNEHYATYRAILMSDKIWNKRMESQSENSSNF